MEANTLNKLTRFIDLERCHELIAGLYEAFRLAELDSVNRRAMWFSQVLQESVGLSATTEFADGSEYEGRLDLGNTEPGDGPRFKGRGFIQLTGRSHYDAFSRWCFRRDLVPNKHFFIDNPDQVAGDDFGWISAAWFWAQPHPHDGLTFLNEAADAGNLLTATHMVNGGEHGLETRKFYYNKALSLGEELMTPVNPDDSNWSDVMTRDELDQHIDERLRALMFGDDVLHEKHPMLFAKRGSGINARLHAHNRRISALENGVKAVTTQPSESEPA
jgi:predicted chitinase